jgi:hypothetical protein
LVEAGCGICSIDSDSSGVTFTHYVEAGLRNSGPIASDMTICISTVV